MITSIGMNKYQTYGKIAMLIMFAGLLLLVANIMVHPRGVQLDGKHWTAPVMFMAFTIVAMLFVVMQLYFLPVGADVNTDEKSITLRFLLMRAKVLYVSDMASYGSTSIVTKSDRYEGVLLHMHDGRTFLLSDFSLAGYTPIRDLLESERIECTGKEKFKFFAYYSNCLRRRRVVV